MKSVKHQPLSSGFSLLEIMIIVAVIGIVLAVGVPNIIKSRDKAQKDTCIANLRQIESAMH